MKTSHLVAFPCLLALSAFGFGACGSNEQAPKGSAGTAGAAGNGPGGSVSSFDTSPGGNASFFGMAGAAGDASSAGTGGGGQGGNPVVLPIAKLPCGAIADGAVETRTMYATASVPAGQTCVSEPQQRTCQDGVFSAWSGTLASPECIPEAVVARNWCSGVPADAGSVEISCGMDVTACANGSVPNKHIIRSRGNDIHIGNANCRIAAQDCADQCGSGSRILYVSTGCGPGADCTAFNGSAVGIGTVTRLSRQPLVASKRRCRRITCGLNRLRARNPGRQKPDSEKS